MSEEKVLRKVEAPIMGVREWTVGNDGSLNSTGVRAKWEPREAQQAKCLRTGDVAAAMDYYQYTLLTMHYDASGGDERLEEIKRQIREAESGGHPAPHKGCSCGLYAFYDRDSCAEHGDGIAQENGVRGVVSAWGKIRRAEYGFRAEYMGLEAIILERESMQHFGATVGLKGAHKNLADRHNVPLIRPEEVSAFVQLSGGTVLEPEEVPVPTVDEIFAGRRAMGLPTFVAPSSSLSHGSIKIATQQEVGGETARKVARQNALTPPKPLPFPTTEMLLFAMAAIIVLTIIAAIATS